MRFAISRWMKQNQKTFAWQEGFGAFSVSPSQVTAVKAYLRNQAEHHRRRSFEEEYVAMLWKSGIDYDPKWVFG
jgi:putative transposase